jgi:diamine N-acetyltransferase
VKDVATDSGLIFRLEIVMQRVDSLGEPAHDLGLDPRSGKHLWLGPIPESETRRLGEQFAAIEPWRRYPYLAADLGTYFATIEPGAPRFAIELGGAIVGVVGIRSRWLRGPYLQFLGVLPEAQGLGLGSKVLGWIEGAARSAGERNLWVLASEFNAGAIAFYERHGFCALAQIPGLVRDDQDEVLMRKRLTSSDAGPR